MACGLWDSIVDYSGGPIPWSDIGDMCVDYQSKGSSIYLIHYNPNGHGLLKIQIQLTCFSLKFYKYHKKLMIKQEACNILA